MVAAAPECNDNEGGRGAGEHPDGGHTGAAPLSGIKLGNGIVYRVCVLIQFEDGSGKRCSRIWGCVT